MSNPDPIYQTIMSEQAASQSNPESAKDTVPSPPSFSAWSAIQTVVSAAVVMATLLTLWTPSNLFSNRRVGELLISVQATRQAPVEPEAPLPTSPPEKIRIGIVAGHWGKNDPGTVCQDGLKEVDVNLQIATLARQQLIALGYDVDLLEELDDRLYSYQAAALVSIHNDSCDYINDNATGFKVAAAIENAYPEKAGRLTNCLVQRYQETTNMKYNFNTVTRDMSVYHAFNEIHSSTPAAIIETGFLNLDRQILTQQPELIAQGIVSGILCYVNNESISPVTIPSQ